MVAEEVTPEEAVVVALRKHKACCSPREVRAVLALLADRQEACAKIAQHFYDDQDDYITVEVGHASGDIAAAIRALPGGLL